MQFKTVYDGSFSGILIRGDGITAAVLKERGIEITDSFQKLLGP
jgi:uncharacterized protein YbbK (DUF523 family)